jgi:hypothetical protein
MHPVDPADACEAVCILAAFAFTFALIRAVGAWLIRRQGDRAEEEQQLTYRESDEQDTLTE